MTREDIIKKILNFGVFPILAITLSNLAKDLPIDKSSKRINKDDFIILKSDVYIDSNTFLRYYIVKNNTQFPISNQNTFISYKSSILPTNCQINSGSGVIQKIPITGNLREVFKSQLPKQLTNEDIFAISVLYQNSNLVDDELVLKVESKKDDVYLNYSELESDIPDVITSANSTIKRLQYLLLGLVTILLYLVLFYFSKFLFWLWQLYKNRQDDNFTDPDNPQFITQS